MNRRPTEERFEEWIEKSFHQHGYSSLPFTDYDKTLCMIPDEVVKFITTTQPKKWDRLEEHYGDQIQDKVLQRISSEISKYGLIEVLRNGVKDRGVYLDLVYFEPKSGLNPEHLKLYEQNQFVVVRQLHYSQKNENSLDMVLFLNGLPVLTMELKNQLTGQNIKHSEYQYKNDRLPKGEPLLQFGRCLVHFCVDNDRVSMTTHLKGDGTKFFPYNKGIENPPVKDDYRTEYLWNEVLTPDSLLDIIENFVVLVEEKEYFYNEKKGDIDTKKFKVLIFPRYHQLEVIRKIRSSVVEEGVGHNYLVQHTTGSGKSYSIGWLSHTLTSLYQTRESEKSMFDTVIVITDRRVLDKQLQNTIKSLEKTRGVVNPIDKTSSQLKDMLEKGKDIIITTIQKFPYISEEISSIGDRTFGVIIDEVHSSQSGENSKEMKKSLSKLQIEEGEEGEFDVEDYIREEIKSRGQQDHISFFGFTGTPKEKTLEVFGRKNEEGEFVPFHTYSMKQSISEGFTLDVLKNYTTYKRFFKLKQMGGEDIEIPSTEGKRELVKFVDSHEITIRQKVGIMLEHFITKGSKGIRGRGRGMIVVRSRKDCVRYFKEINKQLKDRGLKYRSLVGFSGEVKLDGESYTETSLNKTIGHEGDIPLGLKNPKYRLLIVSNKFQTGFDEPLVQSMYVDKKLGGVQCVQTLSRLNRTTSGKTETFVLDFVNEPEDVQSSFQRYYTSTLLEGETDQNKIYDYQRELEDYHLYTKMEVDRFSEIFYNPKKEDRELHPILDEVVERWKRIEEEEKREDFRSTVQSYIRLYGYVSQILTYEDIEFEKLFIFLKYLNKKLPPREREGVPQEIMESIELDSLRIQKMYESTPPLDDGQEGRLEPHSFSVGEPEEQYLDMLSHLVEQINELFGEGISEEDKLDLKNVYNNMTRDDELRDVIEGDNSESNKKKFFREKFDEIILGYVNQRFDFYKKMEDSRKKEFISQMMYEIYNNTDGKPLQV